MPVEELSVFLYKMTKISLLGLLFLGAYYLINIGNNYLDSDKKIIINKNYIIKGVLAILTLIIVYNLFSKYSILIDTFWTIIMSIVFAYLFNPIIKFFESKNIPRPMAILLLYVLILGMILIFSFAILPKTIGEMKKFVVDFPRYLNMTQNNFNDLIKQYNQTITELPSMFSGLESALAENISRVQKVLINGIKSFVTSILGMFSTIVSLILTPILTYYFLVDKEFFIDKALSFIPEENMEESLDLFRKIDKTLSGVVRGRIIMAGFVGVVTTIVLFVFGIDFALTIGIITGIGDVIPYIGPFLGFIPAVFFALVKKPINALWISLIFVLVQWIENNVLGPKVLGETAGLHPMVILLSIIVGGGMFGVVGMILAVPVIGVGVILYEFFKDKIIKKLKINS